MATLKELAIELATVNLVADLVAEHKDNLREQIAQQFELNGSDSVKVSIGDEKIGKVSLVEPKAKATVTDENALFRWVIENREDEIVTEVRPSFKKWLLDNVDVLDDGTAVLKTTGEIIPGISARPASPYVSTRFDTDGRERLGRALRNGEVSFALPSLNTNEIEAKDE